MSEVPEDPPPISCPVNHQKWSMLGQISRSATTSPSSNTTTPQSIEEAARYAQTPQPNQRVSMSTERQVSSIPRREEKTVTAMYNNGGPAVVPHHQLDSATPEKWVYPSEQQIYNAMIRKGHQNIPEESIATVLQIHNGINEKTWHSIVTDWENGDTCQLDRFEGRPRDLSPKAFLLTKVLQKYDPPFDRHDWYITNQRTGHSQRYVIDYYALQSSSSSSSSSPSSLVPYVDVRPAVDDPHGVYLRTRRFLQLAFPGITTFYKQYWQEK